MKELYQMTNEELFEKLHSDGEGLSEYEAKKRIKTYGLNKLNEVKRKNVVQIFLGQFCDLLVVILLVAAGISMISGNIESTIVIVVVLILNAILGTVQYMKAEKSLKALKSLSSPKSKVLRNGCKKEIFSHDIVPGDKIEITVAPKGFGSENMSKIAMLRPSDGLDGVKDFVVNTVEQAGPNPCPPIVVGVGIGGTFDKAAYLAKKALLRPVNQRNPKEFYANLEEELLAKINELGIGPQGFGGRTTALAVNIEEFPTHIAGLPVAVNINCHVTRHKTEVI